MTLLFAAIATMTVGAVIMYILGSDLCKPYSSWVVLGILILYAAGVLGYCCHAYEDPSQRLVTNLLFGLVPWTVGLASYLLAWLLWSMSRTGSAQQTCDSALAALPATADELAKESLILRSILLLAVLPSLTTSIYLTCTVATGFTGVGTFFDVLALCLFVDVWRTVMHLSLLLAPEWTVTITRSAQMLPDTPDTETSASSMWSQFTPPGAVNLTFWLCLAWYAVLAWAHSKRDSIRADPIKIHVLACLTTYLFFPSAMTMASFWNFKIGLKHGMQILTWLGMVWLIATWLLLVATYFDVMEPNTIAVVSLVCSIIYASTVFSESFGGCICIMLLSTLLTSGFVFFSVHYAEQVRAALGEN
eukprot:TRINITY_DN19425_c0_g1_i2.p1 TRINITY_DN19425_c0_g1~~TRINITY_DN19425_c0_g1_i2.p1  ORF type:complete len:361 (+),score=51.49 TRINITY_DN19425_c0_g1_i2:164-1246(+)